MLISMRNNDPYYLGNDTELPSKLIVKTSNTTIDQDLHWDATLEDYLHAFYTAMIGISFDPSVVISGMKEFADEHTEHYLQED